MKSLARSFRAPAICVLFSLCIVFYNPISAFAGVPPVTPEELKMTSEPAAPGAAAIILYRQVDRDDNIHIGHEFNFVRIKILTEEGRKYANIEIPSYKDDADLVGIDARTIQPDGSITKFDGKVFVKPIVKGRGLKLRAKTFTLPDVRVGSVIEYSYTETLPEYSLFNSHWILSDELFIKRALFTLKPCLQVYDQQYFVSWLSSHLPDGTVPPKEGPDHIIRMEAANIPAFKVEDHMPPEDEMKSRVDFVYSDERFEENPQKFWNKKGKRWNSSLENFLGKPQAMQGALAEIVSPGDSAEVKLQKIYGRVQKIRNTSYEQSKTTQE